MSNESHSIPGPFPPCHTAVFLLELRQITSIVAFQKGELVAKIGFVTCDKLLPAAQSVQNQFFTADDWLAAESLTARGHRVEPVLWRAPTKINELQKFDLLLLRSPWDYMEHRQEFFAWLQKIENANVHLENPLATVRWNIDKNYLHDLPRRGVAIPDTRYVHRVDIPDLAAFMQQKHYQEIIVKPTVSAAAYHTFRLNLAQACDFQRQFAQMVRECEMMIQPFIQEVVAQGEWGMIYFQRKYSHAVLKKAKSGDFRVQDDYGGTVEFRHPPDYLRAQADRLVAELDRPHFYARVDGVDAQGKLMVMELEMIEPELFLRAHPDAPGRFAMAIEQILLHG